MVHSTQGTVNTTHMVYYSVHVRESKVGTGQMITFTGQQFMMDLNLHLVCWGIFVTSVADVTFGSCSVHRMKYVNNTQGTLYTTQRVHCSQHTVHNTQDKLYTTIHCTKHTGYTEHSTQGTLYTAHRIHITYM